MSYENLPHRTNAREYNRRYRKAVMKTRKPGHLDCMSPGCCYHGRLNANREAMRRMRQKEKEST